MSWIHIKQYGLEKVIDNIRSQLKNYVNHIGATGKYHETITIAAIKIINNMMAQIQTKSFNEIIKLKPMLLTNFKYLINSHYSFDVFTSSKARITYIKPDVVEIMKD